MGRRSQGIEITAADCIGEAYGGKRPPMATNGHLLGITAQYHEIMKRVVNGNLDPEATRRALQDIVVGSAGTLAYNPPSWWRKPEEQLARAQEIWPGTEMPEPPARFAPLTRTEVLLLHVPAPFEVLWRFVAPPEGYDVDRSDETQTDSAHQRLTQNALKFTDPVWLAFDSEYGKGQAPMFHWGQPEPHLASSEVLSALIQFPDWSLAWFNGASPPVLAGYQRRGENSTWSRCLFLSSHHGHQPYLQMGQDTASRACSWASPSVRVLS